MTPKVFAQAIVSIDRNYGLRLDPLTTWLRMDSTPCGRGWVGTKPPGCKRGSKKEGSTKAKESKLEIAKKTEGKNQDENRATTDVNEEAFRNIVAHTYDKNGITKEKLKALDNEISRKLSPDEIETAKALFNKAIDPTKNEDHILRTTKEVLQIELSKDHYKDPKDRAEATKHYAIVRQALNDVDAHQKGSGMEEFIKLRTHDKKMADWVESRDEINRKKNKRKGTKKK